MFTIILIAAAGIFSVEGQAPGAIALYNNGDTSTSNTAGIVRVYNGDHGQWGNICDGSYGDFGYTEADVVCHQLGYSGASDYSTAGQENYGTDTSPALMSDIDCSYDDNYLVLLQCSHDTDVSGCTNDDDDITVDCYSTPIWNSPFPGMVRLQDGTYSNDGRIEVYCNGQWGTMCDDSGYTQSTGDTVCKQLGYTGASSLTSNAGNDNSLSTWYSSVYCSSYENCLANCQSCPGSSRSCSYSNAGVTCEYTSDDDNYYNYRDTCFFSDPSSFSTGTIVGIIIGSIILFLFCVALFIFVPICICCCLGIGIGAAASSGRRYETI